MTLVDTPDLDGDTPEHHVQADRVFRWCEAVLFVTTPEKYQMTELLPYYRLAARYGLPALYVMNKCEEAAVLDDYRALLTANAATPPLRLVAVARDDFAALRHLLARRGEARLLREKATPEVAF